MMSERYRRVWLPLLIRRLKVWGVIVLLATVFSVLGIWLPHANGELLAAIWNLGIFVGLMLSISTLVTSEFRLGVLFGMARYEVIGMQYWLSFVLAILSGALNRVASFWVQETASPVLMIMMALALQFFFTILLIGVDKCRSSQTMMYGVTLCVFGVMVLVKWLATVVESPEGRKQLIVFLDWIVSNAFGVVATVTIVSAAVLWSMLSSHESRNQVGMS